MNWKEKLKTKANRPFKVITEVMKNIAWHLMIQILVTHRVFLLIIIQVVAGEKTWDQKTSRSQARLLHNSALRGKTAQQNYKQSFTTNSPNKKDQNSKQI